MARQFTGLKLSTLLSTQPESIDLFMVLRILFFSAKVLIWPSLGVSDRDDILGVIIKFKHD